MTGDALVLAGGGVAGIAWETGLLLGLSEGAPGLMDSILSPTTRLIGTSAGSLDPRTRAAFAAAGRSQGRGLADAVARFRG